MISFGKQMNKANPLLKNPQMRLYFDRIIDSRTMLAIYRIFGGLSIVVGSSIVLVNLLVLLGVIKPIGEGA